jgi:hypothetical protein
VRLDDARLVPIPGTSGLTCRFPGVTLFVVATGAADVVGDLVERCRQAATAVPEAGVDAGVTLARQVVQAVEATPPATRPDFAMVTATAQGPLVVVHGPVEVTAIDASADTVQVSGTDTSGGCVEQRLPSTVRSVTAAPAPAPPAEPAAGRSDAVDLERGVVAASGFRLVASATVGDDTDQSTRSATAWYVDPELVPTAGPPGAAPPPTATPWQQTPSPAPAFAPTPVPSGPPSGPGAPPPSFRSVSLFDPGDEPSQPRKPLPVVTDPVEARSAEAEIGQVVVQGVVCPRGHFNDPRARFCSSCGISMAHQTRTLVPGPRPPLGVLVFEDGTTYSLSSNYVVGRQPETHPLVQSHQALPLVLEDGRRTISRAHAELRLDGWDVHFVNLSGTNGSYLWDQQYQQWMALAPGQPVVLAPGMRIAMGQRTAIFESALVR